METEDFHDWSSNCKLETQESWWYNSVSLNVWEPRVLWARKDQYPSSNNKAEEDRILPSAFLFYSGPEQIGCSTILRREIDFTESTDSHFIWRHSHRGKKMFRQISRHPVIQSRWHIKLTITVCLEHIWRNERQVWVLATAKGVSEARNSSPNINSV